MSLHKLESVILKCTDFRETSRIVTFFSRTHGKLRGIAKGVRTGKTKWGGILQTMAYVSLHTYYRKNGGLHLISSGEYINGFPSISESYDKMKLGFKIVELINRYLPENHENEKLFQLTVNCLKILNDATKNFSNVLIYFEFKFAEIQGFSVDIERELSQNIAKKGKELYFYGQAIMPGDIRVLGEFSSGNFEIISKLNISKHQETVMNNFLEKYFKNCFGKF
ncbi:MAG: DNA repair protein RecO [Ignavibacteria bacterium]|nr:DNA repair protein RecO [Ignavibacteria bacterium]